MKLLLDQNISRKLVPLLLGFYPHTSHVAEAGLAQATDRQIWDHASENDYVIISKDSDFRQLAFLLGPPPEAAYFNVCNVSSLTIREIILYNRDTITGFSDNG